MIISRDLLRDVGKDLRFSDNNIERGQWLYQGRTDTKASLHNYGFAP